MTHQHVTDECEYAIEYPFQRLRKGDDDEIIAGPDVSSPDVRRPGMLPLFSRRSQYISRFAEDDLSICSVTSIDPDIRRRFCIARETVLRAPVIQRQTEIVMRWQAIYITVHAVQHVSRLVLGIDRCGVVQNFVNLLIIGGAGVPTVDTTTGQCASMFPEDMPLTLPGLLTETYESNIFDNPLDLDTGEPCQQSEGLAKCTEFNNTYEHSVTMPYIGGSCMEVTNPPSGEVRRFWYKIARTGSSAETVCVRSSYGSFCDNNAAVLQSPICDLANGGSFYVSQGSTSADFGIVELPLVANGADHNWWEDLDGDTYLGIPVFFPPGVREQIPS